MHSSSWIVGVTSSWRSVSSWCRLQPKRCKSQARYDSHPSPHRQPASPQTGGRGYGPPLVEANQGRSRIQRKVEGTSPPLRGGWSQHLGLQPPLANHRQPPLALMQEFIADIVIQSWIFNTIDSNFDQTRPDQIRPDPTRPPSRDGLKMNIWFCCNQQSFRLRERLFCFYGKQMSS